MPLYHRRQQETTDVLLPRPVASALRVAAADDLKTGLSESGPGARFGPKNQFERWQIAYLPVYSVWAALVVAIFPIVFSYR